MHWLFQEGTMTRHRRFAFILFSIFLALTLISCNLALPDAFSNAIKNLTPTPTPPTRTPALSPPPATPLILSGCALAYECLEVENLTGYLRNELVPGVESYIEFPYYVPLRVNLDWHASNNDTLKANLSQMDFFFKIDGVRYDQPYMFKYGYYYDEDGKQTNFPGYAMGVVVSSWDEGEPHLIEYGYTIENVIYDGWKEYQPQTVNYVIRAMPVAQAKYTPFPTPTSKVGAYVPSPTPACPINKTIFILNSTGGTVNLFLTGPANFHFYLNPGENTLNVCDGYYSYTGYGCGGDDLNGQLHNDDRVEFFCTGN
jgi:hypothetical protein